MSYQPIFSPSSTRPTTATLKTASNSTHAILRDQLPITTWLLLGALIQSLAHIFLPYRNIVLVLPVILLLSFKIISTVLVHVGVLPNSLMRNVIPGRTAPVFPTRTTGSKTGKFVHGEDRKPGATPICAILLTAVCNSPLGILAPGYAGVGARFSAMVRELSAHATRYGFLGNSAWLNATERSCGSEYMYVLYFENEEYLLDFAHGEMHTEVLRWWREGEKEGRFGHVGIGHEVFACGEGGWEGVYGNFYPAGLGATTVEVGNEGGGKEWASPLVKIKGKLGLSRGRMGREVGDDEWLAHRETDVDEE